MIQLAMEITRASNSGFRDYNVTEYSENVLDESYDRYGLSISSSHGRMSSFVDLQRSIGDLGFEVIVVCCTIDPSVVKLEQVAHCISLDFKEADFGFLVQRISELVSQHMGKLVKDVNDILATWMERSTELRTSQQTSPFIISYIDIVLSRYGSLQFKVLADNVGHPCRLELCIILPSPSAFSVLKDNGNLKFLTKLSICHFSIRFLPPEIVYLKKLVELDLSFNKMKNLPNSIAELDALKSLRIANNKLVDIPSEISFLRRLENLDLSNNRLITLTPLNLDSMRTLRYLNIQHNKLNYYCQIPSWICCVFGRNEEDNSKVDEGGSLVEASIPDVVVQKSHVTFSYNGSHINSSCFHPGVLSCRCSLTQRMKKGWRRRDNLQLMARQEHLNKSWKLRVDYSDSMIVKMGAQNDYCESIILEDIECESQFDIDEEKVMDHCAINDASLSVNGGGGGVGEVLLTSPDFGENEINRLKVISSEDDSSCLTESSSSNKEYDNENESISSTPATCLRNEFNLHDNDKSSSHSIQFISKSKRHCDRDLDNPKPSKFRKPVGEGSSLSCKYSTESFCSIDDHLPDGFYDAGRNRPFMSLEEYEQSLCLDSREVILLDRNRDEELDAIVSSAQVLLSRFSKPLFGGDKDNVFDNMQRASVLALFVSDCFGGSERSSAVIKLRKAVVGSNKKQQPFICTCSAQNVKDNSVVTRHAFGMADSLNFNLLCENSLRSIKAARGSNVVPIGTLRFGVCRHRAALMKYLCDRADPPIPCELVRGYLDFLPHAWNAILVKRGNLCFRMVVDACYPTDIREETDIEYYCRYIPLSRLDVPLTTKSSSIFGSSFSSPMMYPGTENTQAHSVFRCKFGTLDAAVKVRSLELCKASQDEVRNFEYAFLGEVRMLSALRKHSCIVEIYGHQLSSKWIHLEDGIKENRLLQSIIVMECVKGGSLKIYLDKLFEKGEKHAPIDIALCIARDVACALAELHSKCIIHRDVKSENVLIDMDCKRSDGTPVVKLADFDRSVPLQSSMHTCCNAHFGVHPPDVCVGTPRWMAPEVVQAMHQRNPYGLEVDIWSYGCLLYELLTLRVPFFGHSEAEIYNFLQKKRRPRLTPELEALALFDRAVSTPVTAPSNVNVTADTMYLLVELFYQCTSSDPSDRPSAHCIYEKLDEVARQLYSA